MSAMPSEDPHKPLSAILGELAEHPQAEITLGEFMERFGGRAIGAMLFLFGLICTLPLPPGSTTIFGLPLLLLAGQLLFAAPAPWLPAGVRRRRMSLDKLRERLPNAMKWLRRMEALTRPRLGVLVSKPGERLIGAVCVALGLVLILPIPLGNMLPAASVTVLSFSLVQRDGLAAVLGYALSAASVAVLVSAAHLVIKALQHFATVVSLA